jgi:hypothetical protein
MSDYNLARVPTQWHGPKAPQVLPQECQYCARDSNFPVRQYRLDFSHETQTKSVLKDAGRDAT